MSDLIFRNFWLKMASLVLATLIWLTVQANLDKENRIYQSASSADESDRRATVQRRFDLPVRVRNEGTNRTDLRTVPGTVSITVSGDPLRMKTLQPNELMAFVEISGTPQPGELFPIQVSTPPNINYLRVLPTIVKLQRVASIFVPSSP